MDFSAWASSTNEIAYVTAVIVDGQSRVKPL
jgi:hypothetical protein